MSDGEGIGFTDAELKAMLGGGGVEDEEKAAKKSEAERRRASAKKRQEQVCTAYIESPRCPPVSFLLWHRLVVMLVVVITTNRFK